MIIIGLTGKPGAGKSTAARHLWLGWNLAYHRLTDGWHQALEEHVLPAAAEDCHTGSIGGLVLLDVTAPSQAEWVHRHGGEVWHIVRDDLSAPPFHVDRTIDNHWTLDIFRVHLNTAAADLIGTHHTEAMQ